MRFMTPIITVLLCMGTPVFAESSAPVTTAPGEEAVEPEAAEEGEVVEAQETETKKFVITKGAKLFRYVKFVAGKEQAAVFPVMITKSAPADQNALFRMFNYGACPGSFTIGANNQGRFRFNCRNRFHGFGQLVFDPTTQRVSGRGLINERDEFEFKE